MQFNVPQFIEVEDKVLGPFTLKQALYLAAGGGLLFMAWFFVEFWLFVVLSVIIGIICAIFAFYKVDGRPFASYLNAAINYFIKPKLYIWKKQ